MASTRKLTKSLTRSLTRKLTGAELKQLFLEKFKFTLSDTELIDNGDFSDTDGSLNTIANWTGSGSSLENGKLKITVTNGGYVFAFQPVTYETGSTYQVSFTVNGTSGKDVRCRDDSGNNGGLNLSNGIVTLDGTDQQIEFTFVATSGSDEIIFERHAGSGDWSFTVDNVSLKKVIKQAPLAAFSLRKLGDVSPYACRIRRSSDNTEAQVMFDASDRVSEESVVRNTSHNLLSYSEDFSEWDATAVSRTLDSVLTDPFGGSNAYKLNETTANSFHFISEVVTIPSGAFTFSCYMKAGERTTGSLMLTQSGNFGAVFDLSSGSVSSVNGTGNTASIEAVGTDGWYRCAIHNNGSANIEDFVRIAPQNGVLTSFTGDASKGIYIFGAMLQQTVYESTPSGSELVTNGTFDTDSDWNKGTGVTINTTSKKAVFTDVANGQAIQQGGILTAGKNYSVTFTVSNITEGGVKVRYPETNQTATTNGTFTFTGVSTGTAVRFQADGETSAEIDNVSVKELLPEVSEYISTPVVSNDGLTFTESTLDDFVGGENLVPYSEDFSNAAYFSDDVSVASSSVTDPFGGTGAYKITKTGSNGHMADLSIATTGQVKSIYARTVSGTGTVDLLGHKDVARYSVTLTEEWQRFDFVVDTSELGGNHFYSVDFRGSDATLTEVLLFGAQLNTDSLKKYQKTTGSARDGNAGIVVLYNQTGGEDAIQATQTHQPLLYNAGLLVRSGSSPAWEYPVSNPQRNLAVQGMENLTTLDAFFVHETGSNKQFIYPSSDNSSYFGFIAHDESPDSTTSVFYGSPILEVNGVQKSPSDRDDVYDDIAGRKLVYHRSATTANWTGFNVGFFISSSNNVWNLEDVKFCEWIFFDSDQHSNQEAIEKDINDFHNLF